MQMHAVVPSDEFEHPLPRQFNACKALRRMTRTVLAGSEPGFNMRVIIRYAWATVRWG